MGIDCKQLDDILSAGHPDHALVGVTVAWLRQIRDRLPDTGAIPATPVVATLSGAVA